MIMSNQNFDEKGKSFDMSTDAIYKDTTEDEKNRSGTSNYDLDKLLPEAKIEKSHWINERWTEWKNYYKDFWSKSKKITVK